MLLWPASGILGAHSGARSAPTSRDQPLEAGLLQVLGVSKNTVRVRTPRVAMDCSGNTLYMTLDVIEVQVVMFKHQYR